MYQTRHKSWSLVCSPVFLSIYLFEANNTFSYFKSQNKINIIHKEAWLPFLSLTLFPQPMFNHQFSEFFLFPSIICLC
jgi:hypothetical protein